MGVIENGQALAMNELQNKAGIQSKKYRSSLPFYVELAAAGTPGDQDLVNFTVAGEGDFYAMKFAAKMVGSLNLFYGTSIQIKETGYGKNLFRDFTDLSLLASPGWGVNFYPMIDFEQLFLSKSDIQLEFRNTTAQTVKVWGVLHGWQFIGSAAKLIPGYAS